MATLITNFSLFNSEVFVPFVVDFFTSSFGFFFVCFFCVFVILKLFFQFFKIKY